MEFDWNNPPFNLDSSLTLQEIEESFEDPFAIRLLPDSPRFSTQTRYFNLGVSASGSGVFSVRGLEHNQRWVLKRGDGREHRDSGHVDIEKCHVGPKCDDLAGKAGFLSIEKPASRWLRLA